MTKKVSVIFAIKDSVSSGLKGIRAKMRQFRREAEQLLSNKLVQGLGLGAMVAGLRKATQAFDELTRSTLKLEGVSKITGAPLAGLTETADRARNTFKLSAAQANNFASEMAKIAGKAGDLSKANSALDSFLNIGAARGLDAAATLKAVQQAILGIDEGTDKLFDSNPSVLYKRYADAIGVSVGKLTDQQKAQALLTAATQDGLRVQTAYADFLETTLGQQQVAAVELENGLIELGRALDEARAFGLKAGVAVVGAFRKMLGAFQLFIIDQAFGWDYLKLKVQTWAADTKRVLGVWATEVGELMVVQWFVGDRLEQLGKGLTKAADRSIQELQVRRQYLDEAKLAAQQEVFGITPGGVPDRLKVLRQEAEARRNAELDRQRASKVVSEEDRKAAERRRKLIEEVGRKPLVWPVEVRVVNPEVEARLRELTEKGVDRTLGESAELAGLKPPEEFLNVEPVEAMTGAVEGLRSAWAGVDDAMGMIGLSTGDLQLAFGAAVEAGVADADSFGGAVKGIIGAVGATGKILAKEQYAKGAAKLAEGLWPPNPLAITAGLKHIAAGALFNALVGGGGGGGGAGTPGGGGGLSPATYTRDQTALREDNRAETTVVLRHGFVDPASPEIQDFIANVVEAARDSRRLVFEVE